MPFRRVQGHLTRRLTRHRRPRVPASPYIAPAPPVTADQPANWPPPPALSHIAPSPGRHHPWSTGQPANWRGPTGSPHLAVAPVPPFPRSPSMAGWGAPAPFVPRAFPLGQLAGALPVIPGLRVNWRVPVPSPLAPRACPRRSSPANWRAAARSDLAPSPSVNWSTAVSRSPRPSRLPPPLIARQLASARLPSASVRPCPSPLVNRSTAELLPALTSAACPRSAWVNWRAPHAPRAPRRRPANERSANWRGPYRTPCRRNRCRVTPPGVPRRRPPALASRPRHPCRLAGESHPRAPALARRTTKVNPPTGGLPSPWSAPGGDRPRRPHHTAPPPSARRCRARDGGGVSHKSSQGRADAQRLVATRLLDRLHDPLGHFSRLQRIHPRAR